MQTSLVCITASSGGVTGRYLRAAAFLNRIATRSDNGLSAGQSWQRWRMQAPSGLTAAFPSLISDSAGSQWWRPSRHRSRFTGLIFACPVPAVRGYGVTGR
jgi:hypothetical protein